jgi:hypothetical protein
VSWFELSRTKDSSNYDLLARKILAGCAATGADAIMADGVSDAAEEGPSGRFKNRASSEDTAKSIAASTQRGARSPMLCKSWGDSAGTARASRGRFKHGRSPRAQLNVRRADHTDQEPDDCPRDP